MRIGKCGKMKMNDCSVKFISYNAVLINQGNQIFKDPYLFDFLGTDIPRREVEIEQKLTEHIQKFLLELGQGFAFVGRQVNLESRRSGEIREYLDFENRAINQNLSFIYKNPQT